MNTLIIIPTYNEKNNIGPLIEVIFKFAPQVNILIVDDASPDGTGAVADALSRRHANVSVLHRKIKEGLGRAYIAGFQQALKNKPDYILQMDADFSHHPKYIPAFLETIKTCDLVVGSRYLNGGGRPAHVCRFSFWGNFFVRCLLGLPVTDTLGGFKCFRADLLEKIDLNRFLSHGFIFQTEFIYYAYRNRFRIKELPIVFYPRLSGRSKKSKRIIVEALFKILFFRWTHNLYPGNLP